MSTQLAMARRRAGLTQSELAKKLSVTQSAVSQVESPDANPKLQTVKKIAEALGCKIGILPV